MLSRFPCGSIRNIRFACFDFENYEGRGPTLTNIVVLFEATLGGLRNWCEELRVSDAIFS